MLLTPDIVPVLASTGASARVAAHVAPRFRVGDRVLAASATMTATLDLLEYRGWIRASPTPPTGAAC